MTPSVAHSKACRAIFTKHVVAHAERLAAEMTKAGSGTLVQNRKLIKALELQPRKRR